MGKKMIKILLSKFLLNWSYGSTLIIIHMTIHITVMIKLNHWIDWKSEVDKVVTSSLPHRFRSFFLAHLISISEILAWYRKSYYTRFILKKKRYINFVLKLLCPLSIRVCDFPSCFL